MRNLHVAPCFFCLASGLSVQKTIAAMETKLAGQGRLLIRKSGTEPLIRVMAECTEPALLEQVVDEVVGAVEAVCQA